MKITEAAKHSQAFICITNFVPSCDAVDILEKIKIMTLTG